MGMARLRWRHTTAPIGVRRSFRAGIDPSFKWSGSTLHRSASASFQLSAASALKLFVLRQGCKVRPNYHTQPYEFGGGILFSFEHEGRIREAFVPPDVLTHAGQVPGARAAVEYVERQPDRFIAAARKKAAGRKASALVMIDQLDR